MKKTSKIMAILIVITMLITIVPLSSVMAGVTDSESSEPQIIRVTTTNYFTTVIIEGTVDNQRTGETLNYAEQSEEIAGNYTDDSVVTTIERFKSNFQSFVEENGGSRVDSVSGGITEYYYDAHDEITQNNTQTGSDVILVGDINDLDHAYANLGPVTINTILDKHQTYKINAKATIQDNRIKTIELSLAQPVIGDTIELMDGIDEQDGQPFIYPSDAPRVTCSDGNIEIMYTNWVLGTYQEVGDSFDQLFEGTFEADKYYYAEIGIHGNKELAEGLTITVNGETPAEVFGLYSGNTETRLIAKIKAKEPTTKEYTLDLEKYKLVFTDREGYAFKGYVAAYWNITDEQLAELEISKEEYEAAKQKFVNLLKDYKNILELYEIVIIDNGYEHTGETVIKIKLTDELKQFNSFKLVNITGDTPEDAKLGEVIEGKIEGDYIVFSLPHLSYYALVGEVVEEAQEDEKTSNPQTGDNIYIAIAIFAISVLGIGVVVKLNK